MLHEEEDPNEEEEDEEEEEEGEEEEEDLVPENEEEYEGDEEADEVEELEEPAEESVEEESEDSAEETDEESEDNESPLPPVSSKSAGKGSEIINGRLIRTSLQVTDSKNDLDSARSTLIERNSKKQNNQTEAQEVSFSSLEQDRFILALVKVVKAIQVLICIDLTFKTNNYFVPFI